MTKEQKNEVEKTSNSKTTLEDNDENKNVNWNSDKVAWINHNEGNIQKIKKLQKYGILDRDYDDLLFKTKITSYFSQLDLIISRIGTNDAIYKLHAIEEIFRDNDINSFEDLQLRLGRYDKTLNKLIQENNDLKERLEEALTGGSARSPRKTSDKQNSTKEGNENV